MSDVNRLVVSSQPISKKNINSINNTDFNFNKNFNAFTGEPYERDPFEFLVLEDASAKQFGDGKVFFGIKDEPVSIFDKWGDSEQFARITGGIG